MLHLLTTVVVLIHLLLQTAMFQISNAIALIINREIHTSRHQPEVKNKMRMELSYDIPVTMMSINNT